MNETGENKISNTLGTIPDTQEPPPLELIETEPAKDSTGPQEEPNGHSVPSTAVEGQVRLRYKPKDIRPGGDALSTAT